MIVRYKSAVHAVVDADEATLHDIGEYFSFVNPNAKFIRRGANRNWDGKVRMFSTKTQQLPVGLVPKLESWAAKHNLEFTEEESKYSIKPGDFTEEDAKAYLDSLNLMAGGKPIAAHEHQVRAFAQAIRMRRTLMLSPTASGKSLVAYAIVRWMLDHGHRRILIVVPTKSLVVQLRKDFEDYSSANGWNVNRIMHSIYEGAPNDTNHDVILSTWHSVYKLPRNWFLDFKVVIGDEAHLFKADSLRKIMGKLVDCTNRVAMTGTLDNSIINRFILEGMFGPVRIIEKTTNLIEKGLATPINVHAMILDYDIEQSKTVLKMDYPQEIEWLMNNQDRNRMIVNLTKRLEGNTLLLFREVDRHGKQLMKMVQDAITDRPISYIDGSIVASERESIRNLVTESEQSVLLATVGTFSTGINIPRLSNIIMAHSFKSPIVIIQSIGRILRLHNSKKVARFFDIVDNLSVGRKANYALKQFKQRVEIYKSENYPYQSHRIQMRNER